MRRRGGQTREQVFPHFFSLGPFHFTSIQHDFYFNENSVRLSHFLHEQGTKKGGPARLCFAFVSTTTPPNENHFLIKKTIKNQATRRNGREARATSIPRLRCHETPGRGGVSCQETTAQPTAVVSSTTAARVWCVVCSSGSGRAAGGCGRTSSSFCSITVRMSLCALLTVEKIEKCKDAH